MEWLGSLRRRWSAWWFACEDARTLAAFRVAFAMLVVWDVDGLGEYVEMLFAPSGMFDAAEARARFGGWSDDAGVGSALAYFVQGRFSLLFLCDFRHGLPLVLVALHASAALLLLGRFTRPAAIATLLLYDTLLQRNPVFWEGTEIVLRVFGVLLVCSRCGEVWSLDARRARARDRSWRPSLVPAWPRRLMMVQLAVIVCAAGLAKTGAAWHDGTAVHYALANVHYARFDLAGVLPPAVIAALTWFARAAELLFPLALVGMIARPRRCGWLFGRRIWLSALAVLLLGMWLTMNVGLFHPVMLATLVVYFDGDELGRVVDRLRGRASITCARKAAPLAYTKPARTIASVAIAFQLTTVVLAQLPATNPRLRELASAWLAATRSTQAWTMWATPPRDNVYLRAHAISVAGHATPLAVDLDPTADERPAPFGYERRWKIVGRVIATGEDGPYLDPFARWLCRLELDAGPTATIELEVVRVPIAPPHAARSTLLVRRTC
ncbi:MAG TPA: HTTM domain-containing protein [Nannocystaceae bacterium]|nr:HTTM domain-containing protein [Nannocystaceae bacterium]